MLYKHSPLSSRHPTPSSLYQVDAASEPSGYIPLHLACITGHVGVVGLLLSRSTELLKVTDNAGRTCLHVAAASGHYDMVQVLIGQGADLTTPDKEGWTALHCAASAGFLDVVKLLVESGATSEVRGRQWDWLGDWTDGQQCFRKQQRTEGRHCGTRPVRDTITSSTISSERNMTATSSWRTDGWVWWWSGLDKTVVFPPTTQYPRHPNVYTACC